MHTTLESIKSAAPPVGATLVGWPWWAVAIVLVASCGSSWVMGWLDVLDRLRGDDDQPRVRHRLRLDAAPPDCGEHGDAMPKRSIWSSLWAPPTPARSARATPRAPEALRRLETLAPMADVGPPPVAIHDQIPDAIDLVVRQERAGRPTISSSRSGRGASVVRPAATSVATSTPSDESISSAPAHDGGRSDAKWTDLTRGLPGW